MKAYDSNGKPIQPDQPRRNDERRDRRQADGQQQPQDVPQDVDLTDLLASNE